MPKPVCLNSVSSDDIFHRYGTDSSAEQHTQDIEQATETLKESQVSAAKLRKELSKLAQELQISEVGLPFPSLRSFSNTA